LGDQAFSGGLCGDGLNFMPPVTACPLQMRGMECGRYGSADRYWMTTCCSS